MGTHHTVRVLMQHSRLHEIAPKKLLPVLSDRVQKTNRVHSLQMIVFENGVQRVLLPLGVCILF
jgi:hypothetical protein